MTDLARARALVKELAEVLGEEREPKRQTGVRYEEADDGRSLVHRDYSDGTTKTTSLPRVMRGPEGAG